MNKRLQILLLEDDYMDALFVNHLLHNSGLDFESTRVETEEDFRRELELHPPDVILSDHGFPSFTGMTALAIARKQCPKTPFILVTGRLERELEDEALNGGAAGCVSKDRISDLPPMIHRFTSRTARAINGSFVRKVVSKFNALLHR